MQLAPSYVASRRINNAIGCAHTELTLNAGSFINTIADIIPPRPRPRNARVARGRFCNNGQIRILILVDVKRRDYLFDVQTFG